MTVEQTQEIIKLAKEAEAKLASLQGYLESLQRQKRGKDPKGLIPSNLQFMVGNTKDSNFLLSQIVNVAEGLQGYLQWVEEGKFDVSSAKPEG